MPIRLVVKVYIPKFTLSARGSILRDVGVGQRRIDCKLKSATLQSSAFPKDEDGILVGSPLRLLPIQLCVVSWLGKFV